MSGIDIPTMFLMPDVRLQRFSTRTTRHRIMAALAYYISRRHYANLENVRCVTTVLNFINILKIFDVKIDDFVDKLIVNGYIVPDMDPNREMDVVNI